MKGSLGLLNPHGVGTFGSPTQSVPDFIDFLVDTLPDGGVYVFGGVLRDLALLGQKGFSSDIDLVAEGNWGNCARFLDSIGSVKNKFGGYRLLIGGWSVDVWNARETWAVAQGLVDYRGIRSLTETTVLNWDAILMDWRTRSFIHRDGYLRDINEQILDVVLESNPNPLGMAVRVFRHLCSKEAKKITARAATYLGNCTERFAWSDLVSAERRSYGNTLIAAPIYRFFEEINSRKDELSLISRHGIATDILRAELKLA